jgi:hypothetical protein
MTSTLVSRVVRGCRSWYIFLWSPVSHVWISWFSIFIMYSKCTAPSFTHAYTFGLPVSFFVHWESKNRSSRPNAVANPVFPTTVEAPPLFAEGTRSSGRKRHGRLFWRIIVQWIRWCKVFNWKFLFSKKNDKLKQQAQRGGESSVTNCFFTVQEESQRWLSRASDSAEGDVTVGFFYM